MDSVSVIIADEQTLFRQGLCRIIDQEEGLTSIGEAANGEALLALVEEKRPDLVLMDIMLPDHDGFSLIAALRHSSPASKVIVLSERCSEDEALRALKAGARGYLPKDSNSATLIKCLRVVQSGQVWAESRVTTRLLEEYSNIVRATERPSLNGTIRLTDREYEILRLIAQGYSNREMANLLYISEKTVKTHLSNIFEKIRVTDRLQAALYAIRNRIVEF